MELKTFLEKNKIINTAELSRLVYPHKKTAKQYFNHKLKGTVTAPGRTAQHLTKEDVQKAIEVLKELAKDIEKLI